MYTWGDSGALQDDWRPRSGALMLSIAVHLLILVLLRSAQVMQPEPTTPSLLPVSLITEPRQKQAPAAPPPVSAEAPPEPVAVPAVPALPEPPPDPVEAKIPLPEQQIVSLPDGGVEQPPVETRLLSDRDNTVEEQMVQRGLPEAGSDDGADPRTDPAETESEASSSKPAAERAALPNINELLPDAMALAQQDYGKTAEIEEQSKSRERQRSAGSWPATSEPIGTLDFLPDVRQGDITLLNTKAELFAPFVRRVALRVFQNLVISLRRDLSGVGPSTQEQVGAEAIMNGDGNMIGFNIVARSPGVSLGVDRKLRQACADGFFDRNPPLAAKSDDGNIHFMLSTQVVTIGDPRGFRVGYRVSFQAGLL